MSILLVGCNGNMGKRYASILSYLGKSFDGVDVGHNRHYVKDLAHKCEGVILATPTHTHAALIQEYLPYKKPILCEKPITKDILELRRLFAALKEAKTPFRMVNQYKVLADRDRIGRSHYNYFKHGTDGLYWDCIQIIGLARGDLAIGESSPIWRCMINGKAISLSHMDAAYIAYMQEWFQNPGQDLGEILAAHEKTEELERLQKHG